MSKIPQVRQTRQFQHTSTARQQEPSSAIQSERSGRFVPNNIYNEPGDKLRIRNVVQPRSSGDGTSDKVSRYAARVAAEEAAQERTFDGNSYPAEDEEFWKKYDELWKPSEDWGQDTLGRAKRANNQRPAFKLTRSPRSAWRLQTPEKRRTELYRATHGVQDVTRARKRFRIWKKDFSRLSRATEAGEAPSTSTVPTELKRLLKLDSTEAMKATWQSQSRAKRDASWNHVMMGALCHAPERAHTILRAIFAGDHADVAPFYAVNDSINFLAQRTKLDLPGEHKEELLASLCELLLMILQNTPKDYLLLRQNTLYLIFRHAKPETVDELYSALKAYGHPLHSYTLLQFGCCLAKDVDYKPVALDILQDLATSGSVDINSPHGAALCTSIISLTEEDALKDLKPTPAEFFEMLLGLGLKPNLITYTTIIRNLCLNKELNVAWEVFGTMREHQIDPDIHVYSILLNGAKLCDDFESVSKVVRLASASGIGAPILWNDILHTIFLLYVREARARRLKRPWRLPAFQPMLRAYSKLFRVEPLQALVQSDLAPLLQTEGGSSGEMQGTASWQVTSKALSLIELLPSYAPGDRLEPEGDTLGLMLLGYIGGFEKAYSIIAFYSRFRGQLKNGDPTVARFVHEKGTLLHNIVIKAVVEWPGMLRVALDVVSDMLKDSITAVSDRAGASPTSSSIHGEAIATHHPPLAATPGIYCSMDSCITVTISKVSASSL